MVYEGSVVGYERVVGWEHGGMRAGLGCERVLDVDVVVVVKQQRCGGSSVSWMSTLWWW